MITFKNDATKNYFIMSLQIYSDIFNSTGEATRKVIVERVMDHQFVCDLINLVMLNAEKCFQEGLWKENAKERLAEVDLNEVKRALAKTHYAVLAESI